MRFEKPIQKSEYSMTLDLVTSPANMGDNYPKSVKCNPYNVGQMKKLAYAPNNELYLGLLADIMDNCVDVDVQSLTMTDFMKLVLHLRVNSSGSESTYNIKCPACQTTYPVQVELTKFDIVNFPKGFEEEREVSDNLHIHLPRVKTKIEQGIYQRENELTDLDEQIPFIKEGETFEEKKEIHDNATPELVTEIEKYADEVIGFGVDNVLKRTCNQVVDQKTGQRCGQEVRIRIPFRHAFFLPDFS